MSVVHLHQNFIITNTQDDLQGRKNYYSSTKFHKFNHIFDLAQNTILGSILSQFISSNVHNWIYSMNKLSWKLFYHYALWTDPHFQYFCCFILFLIFQWKPIFVIEKNKITCRQMQKKHQVFSLFLLINIIWWRIVSIHSLL